MHLTIGGPLGVIQTVGQRDQLHREIGSFAFDLQISQVDEQWH